MNWEMKRVQARGDEIGPALRAALGLAGPFLSKGDEVAAREGVDLAVKIGALYPDVQILVMAQGQHFGKDGGSLTLTICAHGIEAPPPKKP